MIFLLDFYDNYNWWVMGRDIFGVWKFNFIDVVYGFEMRWVCGSSIVVDLSVVVVYY